MAFDPSAPPSTDLTADVGIPQLAVEEAPEFVGVSPYRLALRRLGRNRAALAFGGVFVLVVVLCVLAPVYSHDIAHIGPNDITTGAIKIGGKKREVLNSVGVPIGPTWHSRYLLGADNDGRDVAVRLLYGGRNSLEIGAIASVITLILATLVGLVAGYFRGFVDGVLSRLMDLIWSYPVVLLGVALGTSITLGGINLGLFTLHGNSLFVPAIIIGVVYVPYVAKPLRGQVLGLREREFVDAARVQGMSSPRILFSEILPNVASLLIVFVPLIIANAILLEAALSYLGAGVQPPNPSWGTMIADGIHELPGAIHQVLVPGIMLTITVLGVNIFGDGVRDALDPRATIRIRR
jgi:peptide/nickel transport system permease protein